MRRGCRSARGLFQELPRASLRPDVFCCSALISACGKGAQWQKALSLFESMWSLELKPNAVSHLARYIYTMHE